MLPPTSNVRFFDYFTFLNGLQTNLFCFINYALQLNLYLHQWMSHNFFVRLTIINRTLMNGILTGISDFSVALYKGV